MNAQDRKDVLLIVEAVLEEYLTEDFTKVILGQIEQSIQDNWHILKLIHDREVTTT